MDNSEKNNNISVEDQIKKEKNENEYEEKNEQKKKYELIKKREEEIREEIIDIVLRQTTYSREESINHLENSKYDFNKVIRNYLMPKAKEQENENKVVQKKINIQQGIYKEIRNMMDSASRKQRQNI